MNRAAAGYRSEGKIDAKDARVIADQARMRSDLVELHAPEELVVKLRMLTTRRALVCDRTRAINRLRQQLTALCPALERVADVTGQHGWDGLLSRYQRPQAIRHTGAARLTRILLGIGGIREATAATIAETAVTAMKAQTTQRPGKDGTGALVTSLAKEVLRLDARVADLDAAVEARVHHHRLAEVITSLPGMGLRIGAEFLSATGGMSGCSSADHLAAYASLAPVPNDSGKRIGRLHRPQRYNR